MGSEQEHQTKGVNKGIIFFTTDNGECVRSKSELTIANKLYHKGIKYRYEEAHYMKGYGTVYPDFTILNVQTRKEILWEHFGVHSSLLKLNTYAKNGIFPGNGLIITYESKDLPLDTKIIDTLTVAFFGILELF